MSKNSRSTKLRHRPSRSLAASIVAIVLLGLGIAAVWFSVVRLSTGAWPEFLTAPTQWLASLSWNSPGTWTGAIVAVVIGVILLLAALVPGKFNGMQLDMRPDAAHDDGGRATEVLLTSRAVSRLAAAHAGRMDGVVASKAKSKGNRVRLRVSTPLHQPGDLRQRVADSVRERLQSAGPTHNPKVGVRVRSTDD